MASGQAVESVHTGWRLALIGLAWPAGVAVQLQERALADVPWHLASLGVGVAFLAMTLALMAGLWHSVTPGRRSALITSMGALGLLLVALGSTGWRAHVRLDDALPAMLEGRDLQVVGVVAGLPQRSSSGIRFPFEIEDARLDGEPVAVPSRAMLGWYVGYGDEARFTPQQLSVGAGQRWSLTVRLRRPHALINPHGFDGELQSFEDGIRAVGTVRAERAAVQVGMAAGHAVDRLRQTMRDAIDAAVPDRRAAGVLAALAIGDQSAIERSDWDLFRQTGIAHLVSISGLHVTMFAWLAGAACAALWRRHPRALLWVPTPTLALWSGVVAAGIYAVFSGWGVPAQRTVWMLVTVALLRSASVRWPWPLVMLCAATVVTVIDPWALLQPGFWLSFMAVALLMTSGSPQGAWANGLDDRMAHPRAGDLAGGEMPSLEAETPTARWKSAASTLWKRIRTEALGGLRTQWIATLGLAPLTLVFFQQVSLVGFVANLVAIPLVTLLITPLALLGGLASPLWTAGAWVVTQLAGVLQWLASAPVVVWSAAVAPPWAQAAGLLAGVLLVAPLPWRVRVMALPLLLPLLVPPRPLPPVGHFELVAADIGQGTAVIVRTRHHVLLYDTGPQYSPESDAGARVLLPLLRARGDHRIDRLVLSHRDTDHVGGAASLLRELPITELSSSLEPAHLLLQQARARDVRVQTCEAGQSWVWDGVRFEVLHPSGADLVPDARSNTVSCVLKVQGASGSALLTGDIERDQEIRLLRQQPTALRSDVLIVPHHGSRTSSIAAFLDVVRPTVAVFQAGHRNRYGHPAPDVVSRYRERGIAVVSSPACGAWTWRSNDVQAGVVDDPRAASGAAVGAARIGRCEREDSLRYWRWRETSSP